MGEAKDWWRGPKGVGAAGVALLAGGYAGLASLADGAAAADHHLAPLARVAFYAGVFLVLAAAVLWYRQPPAPPVDPDDELEPEGD